MHHIPECEQWCDTALRIAVSLKEKKPLHPDTVLPDSFNTTADNPFVVAPDGGAASEVWDDWKLLTTMLGPFKTWTQQLVKAHVTGTFVGAVEHWHSTTRVRFPTRAGAVVLRSKCVVVFGVPCGAAFRQPQMWSRSVRSGNHA